MKRDVRSKIAERLDIVADTLQKNGLKEDAERLDVVSNTLESADPFSFEEAPGRGTQVSDIATKKAMGAAADVIEMLDKDLAGAGKGRSLSSVPGFEGQNFVDVLRKMAK